MPCGGRSARGLPRASTGLLTEARHTPGMPLRVRLLTDARHTQGMPLRVRLLTDARHTQGMPLRVKVGQCPGYRQSWLWWLVRLSVMLCLCLCCTTTAFYIIYK